ncbi:MAG: hypothetical protein HYX92_09675 [Chloroflexi bacterium]|nr:hypothetical protein [Chloroflexota bacterium]
MVAETDVLLNPVGEVDAAELKLAPRLKTLQGTAGGFIDNNKVNSDVLIARVAELLVEKHGMSSSFITRKPSSSKPVPPTVMAEVEKSAFVVHAHAD